MVTGEADLMAPTTTGLSTALLQIGACPPRISAHVHVAVASAGDLLRRQMEGMACFAKEWRPMPARTRSRMRM